MKKAGILLIGMFLVAAGYAALSMNDIIIPEQALPDAFQTAFSQLAAAFSQPAVESPGALPASSTVYFFANGQRIAKRTNGETFYFHNDHLGSATVVTDSAGQIVEEKMYDPFGMDLAGSSKIGYNSKELDKDTELNYYGARYYAADFGRFVTPDTVKGKITNPQSLNLYAYTLNNPMKYVDPSGEQAVLKTGGYVKMFNELTKPIFERFPVVQKAASLFGYGSGEQAVATQAEDFALGLGTATAGAVRAGAVIAKRTAGLVKISDQVERMITEIVRQTGKSPTLTKVLELKYADEGLTHLQQIVNVGRVEEGLRKAGKMELAEEARAIGLEKVKQLNTFGDGSGQKSAEFLYESYKPSAPKIGRFSTVNTDQLLKQVGDDAADLPYEQMDPAISGLFRELEHVR